jgi:hypothetical protein
MHVHPVWWIAPSPTPLSPSIGISHESARQLAKNLLYHFKQRYVPTETRRALNLEFISVKTVQIYQRPDDQRIYSRRRSLYPINPALAGATWINQAPDGVSWTKYIL